MVWRWFDRELTRLGTDPSATSWAILPIVVVGFGAIVFVGLVFVVGLHALFG